MGLGLGDGAGGGERGGVGGGGGVGNCNSGMDGSKRYYVLVRGSILSIIIKMKIHSSCEIEDFFETHLCNLCVVLRSRVLLGVSVGRGLPLKLPSSLACTRLV